MIFTVGVEKHLGPTITSTIIKQDEYPTLEQALDELTSVLPKNIEFPAVLYVQGYNSVGYPADYLRRACVI